MGIRITGRAKATEFLGIGLFVVNPVAIIAFGATIFSRMKTYRISEEKARAETPVALRRSVVMTVIALLTGCFIGARSIFLEGPTGRTWLLLAAIGVFVATMVLYKVSKTRRFMQNAYSSFEFEIDGDLLTKKQKNTPTVTLLRSQVTRIEEFQGKGFRICTADRYRNIWIPMELEGYEELKADLLSSPIDYRQQQRSWFLSYLYFVALILLLTITVLVANKYIAAGAAFLMSAWLLWAFFLSFKNPNLSSRGRRQVFFLLLIVVAMAARGILLLRG
jgi:hypothetical protein